MNIKTLIKEIIKEESDINRDRKLGSLGGFTKRVKLKMIFIEKNCYIDISRNSPAYLRDLASDEMEFFENSKIFGASVYVFESLSFCETPEYKAIFE